MCVYVCVCLCACVYINSSNCISDHMTYETTCFKSPINTIHSLLPNVTCKENLKPHQLIFEVVA